MSELARLVHPWTVSLSLKSTANSLSRGYLVARLTDELGWFEEAQAAGCFALAYAVRAGIEPGQTGAPVETRWSPDLLDPSGEIRALLRAMYPDTTTPIRLMEYLIDEGLSRIAARIDDGEVAPTALLG